jgi:hypothetical protein
MVFGDQLGDIIRGKESAMIAILKRKAGTLNKK